MSDDASIGVGIGGDGLRNRSGAPLGVLMIEDETLVAVSLHDALEDLGCQIIGWALSAADAERLAAATPPDVLLADIRIKGRPDGIVAAHRLRERYNMPIVFVTGVTDASLLTRAHQLAPARVLQKPFTREELRKALISACGSPSEHGM